MFCNSYLMVIVKLFINYDKVYIFIQRMAVRKNVLFPLAQDSSIAKNTAEVMKSSIITKTVVN